MMRVAVAALFSVVATIDVLSGRGRKEELLGSDQGQKSLIILLIWILRKEAHKYNSPFVGCTQPPFALLLSIATGGSRPKKDDTNLCTSV